MRQTSHLVLKNELLLPSKRRLCFKYLKIFQKIIIEHQLNGNATINRKQLIVTSKKKKKAEMHQHSVLLIRYEPCSSFYFNIPAIYRQRELQSALYQHLETVNIILSEPFHVTLFHGESPPDLCLLIVFHVLSRDSSFCFILLLLPFLFYLLSLRSYSK